MEVSFCRQWNKNYLMISKEPPQELDYQMHMLINNHIPGLLLCHEEHLNGRQNFCYEISSRQTLKQMYENNAMSYKEWIHICQEIAETAEHMENYLLDMNRIRFHPEFIYMEPESKKLELCFLPFPEIAETDLYEFGEFLLDVVDKEDKEAIKEVYEMYEKLQQQNINIKDIFSGQYHPCAGKQPEEKSTEITPEKETVCEDISADTATQYIANQEKEQNFFLYFPLLLLPVLLFFAAYKEWYSKDMKHIDSIVWEYIPAVLVCMVAGIILIFFKRRRKEKKEEEFLVELSQEENIETTMQEPEDYGETICFAAGTQQQYPGLYSKSGSGREGFEIRTTPFIIGKLKDRADAVLEDRTVSRVHAKITEREGEYYVEDLNSTNGTFVNGKRIENYAPICLQSGDILSFGSSSYLFVMPL